MTQKADDTLDRLFHAVEFVERRIDPDRPVHEDASEAGVLGRIDHLWFADRRQQALRWRRVDQRILAAGFQIVSQGHLSFAVSFEGTRIGGKNIIDGLHWPLRW